MRRCVFVSLVLFSFGASVGLTQDKAKTGPMTIEYHGQSFYVLTTTKGKRIAFDPHFIEAYQIQRENPLLADVICISHNHNDHKQIGVFENFKKAKILRGLKGDSLKADWNAIDEKIEDGDIKVKNVGVYHDDQEGFFRGKNSVFIIEVDGWRICHLGDLGHILTPAQLKRIGKVDVLMVPAGGIFTLNGAEARKVVDQIKPKEYVFPMHFGTKIFDDILTCDEFFDGLPARNVVRLSENEPDPTKRENVISLNKDANRPRPLYVQLHYWPKEEKKKK